ncbi:MAG: hypothetical protein AAGF46_11605, partial [Pseudomonadota bacterium]
PTAPTADQIARLMREAKAADLIRLTVNQETIWQSAVPEIVCGLANVVLPPGGFLQAVASAQHVMAKLIVDALPRRAKRAADLFSGLGAFTFPLAEHLSVTAYDSDGPAIEALKAAARSTAGIKPVVATQRNLFNMPLSRQELAPFDMVVFDPPRAGAKQQASMIAKAGVPVVVAVSCNPVTLARDIKLLLDARYVLKMIHAIDQFAYSTHVEALAVLWSAEHAQRNGPRVV